MQSETIYLTGFMGSGKSYTGVRLARRLGIPFVDLDAEIEQMAGCTISEIFSRDGEVSFREVERDILRRFGRESGCVLSTGGGAPCFHDNMDWMNGEGTTVFLDPPLSVLLTRLEAGRDHRPLLQTGEALAAFVAGKLASRRADYEKAKIQLRLADPEADVARLLVDLLR